MSNPVNNFFSPLKQPEPFAEASEESNLVNSVAVSTKARFTVRNSSPTFRERICKVTEKVKQIAQFILKAAFTSFLYWVNPSLFAIGFIAGIILDDQVRCAIQKIKNVWVNQKLAGCLFGTFACGLSMPVTLATASLLWSAHFGSLITPNSIPNPQTSATVTQY
jgi:hypothetical protein